AERQAPRRSPRRSPPRSCRPPSASARARTAYPAEPAGDALRHRGLRCVAVFERFAVPEPFAVPERFADFALFVAVLATFLAGFALVEVFAAGVASRWRDLRFAAA